MTRTTNRLYAFLHRSPDGTETVFLEAKPGPIHNPLVTRLGYVDLKSMTEGELQEAELNDRT